MAYRNLYILIVYTLVLIKMDPTKCKKKPRRRTRHISIRINDDVLPWLRENNYSATAVFYEAIKELGYKQKRR